MSTITNTQKQATPPFPALGPQELQALSDEHTRAARLRAFEDYAASSAPTAQTEDWRRSPHSLLQPPKSNNPLAAAYVLQRQACEIIRLGPDSLSCVGAPIPGLSVCVPRSAPTPDVSAHHQGNRACWTTGLRLVADANTQARITVLIEPPDTAPLWIPRIEIEAGPGAQLVVEERLVDTQSTTHVLMSRALTLDEASRLDYAALTGSGQNLNWVESDSARVGRDAVLHWTRLHAGGKDVKSTFTCQLAEPGAEASLKGLVLGHGKQHIDQRFLQLHEAPHTTSRSLYKTALSRNARSVYQGMIDVRPGCNQVDAYQTNNNLLLSSTARADSIPGLEIEAHDLSCSHGSTTGQPDPEQIFYLQSRGLTKNQALKMIVSGFLEPIIEELTADMHNHVRKLIEQHMDEAIRHEHG